MYFYRYNKKYIDLIKIDLIKINILQKKKKKMKKSSGFSPTVNSLSRSGCESPASMTRESSVSDLLAYGRKR